MCSFSYTYACMWDPMRTKYLHMYIIYICTSPLRTLNPDPPERIRSIGMEQSCFGPMERRCCSIPMERDCGQADALPKPHITCQHQTDAAGILRL